MISQLANQITHKIDEVSGSYYRLVLLVGAAATLDCGRLAEKLHCHCVNVNLELSRQMLPLTARQRALRSPALLDEIIMAVPQETVLLNHIHILFDPTLRQDPLRLLQNLSRRKTIIAVWEGELQELHLVYAVLSHPEYRRYSLRELIWIDISSLA